MTKEVDKSIADLLSRTRYAGNELREGVQSLRDHIDVLSDRKAEVLRRPVSYQVAEQRLTDWIASKIAVAREESARPEDFVWSSEDGWRQPPFPFQNALAVALAEQMRETMVGDLKKVYENLNWIDEVDRQAELAKFDREILDAELAEESIIRAAEASGFPVQRRANADPRAVLAADEVLP